VPDILLVQPPVEDFYLTRKRTLPYGLAAIAGSLRSRGYDVEIFDALATDKTRMIHGRNPLNTCALFTAGRTSPYFPFS
jgi:hypothetical protein